jgi:hypothetical protein
VALETIALASEKPMFGDFYTTPFTIYQFYVGFTAFNTFTAFGCEFEEMAAVVAFTFGVEYTC